MTEELRLEPQEAVIMRMEKVGYGKSFLIPANNNELIGPKGETQKCPYCGTFHTF